MARAKRTNRADARRRYRQAVAGDEPVIEPSSAAAATRTPPSPSTTTRPSITGALRGAYRPIQLREDIAALPTLVRHWSFWVPVLLIVGATLAATVAPSNVVVALLFQALVWPPAMAAVFIVGFFARRAAYLLGGIMSTVSVLAFTAFFLLASAGRIAGLEPSTENLQGQLLSAFTVGPISGVLFGSAAAWYRRFLSLTNASRPQRGRSRSNGRPSGRR